MDNDNKSPLVGVLIPVYNRREDVRALLKTVYDMDYPNFDVTVIDNESTDDVAALAKFYPATEFASYKNPAGAPGAWNNALRHALAKHSYKYLFLLDSDLLVDKRCLSMLVEVMEADDIIAMAGAKILNKLDRSLIVEAGARVDLAHGQVYPLFANQPDVEDDGIIDVDYVGIGTALARVSAVEAAGPMDERYYYLWADKDYGLAFNRAGGRVVAVMRAVVYHPPFTEKRDPLATYYYGNRNRFLAIGKYLDGTARLSSFYVMSRIIFKFSILNLLRGRTGQFLTNMRALIDFMLNRWGRLAPAKTPAPEALDAHRKLVSGAGQNLLRRVLILPNAKDEHIKRLITRLRSENPAASIHLLVQDYRKDLFGDCGIDEYLMYDDKTGNVFQEHLSVFFKIIRGGYDCVINPDYRRDSPFVYAAKRALEWDDERGEIFLSGDNFLSVWKIVLTVLAGEALALFVTPILYLASARYNRKNGS
jgi:hypothetical protein